MYCAIGVERQWPPGRAEQGRAQLRQESTPLAKVWESQSPGREHPISEAHPPPGRFSLSLRSRDRRARFLRRPLGRRRRIYVPPRGPLNALASDGSASSMKVAERRRTPSAQARQNMRTLDRRGTLQLMDTRNHAAPCSSLCTCSRKVGRAGPARKDEPTVRPFNLSRRVGGEIWCTRLTR